MNWILPIDWGKHSTATIWHRLVQELRFSRKKVYQIYFIFDIGTWRVGALRLQNLHTQGDHLLTIPWINPFALYNIHGVLLYNFVWFPQHPLSVMDCAEYTWTQVYWSILLLKDQWSSEINIWGKLCKHTFHVVLLSWNLALVPTRSRDWEFTLWSFSLYQNTN